MAFYKDESLDKLAINRNVAQFVSFRPTRDGVLNQHFCRVAGHAPNFRFESVESAIAELLSKSVGRSVNIRSFKPEDPRSKEFVYGISSLEVAVSEIRRLANSGLCLIVNETIDVMDGGVSGVVQGGLIEFAPDDTPRCVEKPGTASLPFDLGIDVLESVYGFRPDLVCISGERVEFSIHPRPQGWLQTHTLLWELEVGVTGRADPKISWPNRFSRHIGDKAFGLLVAEKLGFKVPRTSVISRRVAPFTFGGDTGSSEIWVRTAPKEPHPGLFTTVKGWIDPFKLLEREDPEGEAIASLLCQAAVPAKYSGAAISGGDNSTIIEGTRGEGDRLMLGLDLPQELPVPTVTNVSAVFEKLRDLLGPVRFEWVFDGTQTWIVQLHRGGTGTITGTIVPGEAERWTRIAAELPLERIRELVHELESGTGLIIVGDIGLTSHIADLVRKAGRPAKVEKHKAA